MRKEEVCVINIPAIIWGEQSEKVYLYVHGQGGNKEEAALFASIAQERNYQVISIDLPGHGSRQNVQDQFDPWHVIPELTNVMKYIRARWSKVGIFANSIGAWYSMLSYENEIFEHCFFLSPILDMARLISNMMKWSNVTEECLREKQVIPTDFGQTLYWDYYQYAKNHPIMNWNHKTDILYGTADHLTEYDVVTEFTNRFQCKLTTLKDGEHWFHTKEQLKVEEDWIREESF